ncbi:bacteriocin immunity protein [Dellaglioa carnosa]|uniref:Bacteriocin immunity protein n=1 Tax=Dellaglioa carnosa TaxID=2995136 RepID=A0ABT4JMR9_9LACO|nr:bacteriocin immunity protein [Dellaglioa carnosa]MCZ2491641.1 bacteriocin immunity protein [Dellaglioa carnosa]MCZ2494718.1 bacteriocin immunity protein [Dellaglioa carnosa]MDK1731623.1 bacteriocin immunity protein [Dellaglioa carnosa]
MKFIKWFSGGNDRSEEAIKIISSLVSELDDRSNSLSLVLSNYKKELTEKRTSVPFILSRMNIDISNALKQDKLLLNTEQSKKLKQLTALSNIRYGY